MSAHDKKVKAEIRRQLGEVSEMKRRLRLTPALIKKFRHTTKYKLAHPETAQLQFEVLQSLSQPYPSPTSGYRRGRSLLIRRCGTGEYRLEGR